MDRLPPVSEDERPARQTEHRRPNSRLACQVKADSALDGATITIVAE
jgi:2Fe-2S ferredoxin